MANFGTFSTLGLQKRLRRFVAVSTPIALASNSFKSSVVESKNSFMPIELPGTGEEHSIALVSNKFSASGLKSYFPQRPHLVEDSTSLGGRLFLIDKVGSRLKILDFRNQPSINALDRFIATLASDGGVSPFLSASAAAPQAAAIAALISQKLPTATNDSIYNARNSPAADISITGYDPFSGSSFINDVKAIDSLVSSVRIIGWDIAPYTPIGWDGPLVISTVASTNTNAQSIATSDTLYIDFALTNNGEWATDNGFYVTLSVDGVAVKNWFVPAPLYYGQLTGISDYVINPLAAGSHTLTVTLDSSNAINEGPSYEANNVFSQAISVLSTSLPAISVIATDANAAETVAGATANQGVYTLTRSVVTASPLTVNVSMSGAAINGTDYASIPTTVIFAANSSTAIVSLAPIDDTLLEQPESASLTIGAGAGYTIGTVASATATIADNDLGSIAIAKTTDGSETGPLASVFTLTRTGSSASALNVIYTLGGTAARGLDYTGTSPGTAAFAAGSATKTIILPTINDVLVDSNETIIATITAPTGYIISGPASATATIADNDLGSIAIAKTTDGSETGPLASVFTLTRTGNSASALNVTYTLGGTAARGLDYTGTSPGTATFAAGSATTTIVLPTINDVLVDPNETIIATITAPTGYIISGPASATATIADNDLGSIAIAKTTDGSETGPLASVFTLTRTGSSAAALNVSYTLGGAATQGLDYTGTSPGTATFAAGSATTTITLPTINDVLVDPNETIIATITAPIGYIISGPASATATIADNEPVGLSVVTLASNYSGVSENGTPNHVYSFTRSGATTGGLAVNFTVGGTAAQGTDFLATGATLSETNGIINFAAGSAIV